MTTETKNQLIKRFNSLLWRMLMMCSAVVIDFTAQNIGLFEMPPELTIFLGLLLGEASKLVNNKIHGYI